MTLTAFFFLFKACKNIPAASFRGMGSLEVVNDDICRDNLKKSKYGAGVPRPEVPEQAAFVRTEL